MSDSFDEVWYLRKYADVAAAVSAGRFGSGQEHYRLFGRAEGRQPTPPSQAKAIRPIMVTAPGRSGTTLMMALLASSANVCVAEVSPYEVRLMAYYATVLQVLTAVPDDRSTHPDRLEGDGLRVGSSPFFGGNFSSAIKDFDFKEFRRSVVAPEMISALRNIIIDYYTQVSTSQGKQPAFFAEKNNNTEWQPRSFMRRAFPSSHEIVIVRDPRDVFCSHRSYFKSSVEKAMQDVTAACRAVLGIAEEGKAVFVHYERLLDDRNATLGLLSDTFGVEFPPVDVPFNATHATSGSASNSVGRWRRDMTPSDQAVAHSKWETFLSQFGYL